MTARIIYLPRRYPTDLEGVEVFRVREGWALRRMQGGRIVEMRGLSRDEMQSLHDSLEFALSITD